MGPNALQRCFFKPVLNLPGKPESGGVIEGKWLCVLFPSSSVHHNPQETLLKQSFGLSSYDA